MDAASVQSSDGGDMDLTEPESNTETPADFSFFHKLSPEIVKFYTYSHRMHKRQKVVSSYSTVTKGASSSSKPRAALKQVFLNQGVVDRNLTTEEKNQLDVLKLELEAFAVPVSLRWRWREEKRGSLLERNWTDIVKSHSTMSRMQRHQQEAMWEFVLTELNYINKLIITKDLAISALVNMRLRGFLQEVTPELLFSNLPTILSAHQLFWQEVIYPMLELVRLTGKPFNPIQMEAGFLQFSERFSSYYHYCAEEENSFEFARQQMESNPQFVTFVQWLETHPQGARMRLGEMQAKPHQRITKYSLLLKALLKTTLDPHAQRSLQSMLSSVNSFLERINEYLRRKDEDVALSMSAQRVEGYQIEGINEEIDKYVREICQFDLTCPMRGVSRGIVRKLLLEENLKIRGRKDSKLEVVILLFSDVLLVTKVQKKDERLKVVRPPLALDRMHCIALKDNCSFLLVEVGELLCPVNVYTFTASTAESCSTWVSTIQQAQVTLRNLREANKRSTEAERTSNTDPIKQALISEKQTLVDNAAFERLVTQLANGPNATENNHIEGSSQRFATKDHEFRINPAEELSQSLGNGLIHTDHSGASVKKEDPLRGTTSSLYNLVPGGYPDVDYPTVELTQPPKVRNQSPTNLIGTALQPETKVLPKSPILRRAHQSPSVQMVPNSRWSQSNTSSSNSDSECSLNTKNSNIVLTLSALKPTKGTFWNNDPRASSDTEVYSEPELTVLNSETKKPRLKTQRSVSNLNEEQRFHYQDNSSGGSASPATVENLLQRAKGRARDRDTSNESGQLSHLQLPAPLLTSSSPSTSDGDRDEIEEFWPSLEALKVSEGWREQPVDNDSDKLDSPLFTNGINVDWPGWCLQDEELTDCVKPETKGLLDGIEQSLTMGNLSEQEDNYWSEV
ncbi:pleckstrin homology domain-containing family G member 5 [Corythoichthys intestinalis]|uniref:pleckstrin homology domain-containing family G member 5 n=1 Tax=Corythoichthys intestinalis TaxID=161448 RepID=UPI0025A5D18C|nr:pleckstrin homology domain-containing family G member 5 [Corythoichthys intestinalis]XP_057689843.1 pleckstrin homology domain-containing family G member 5 [Corythoichthys intestinalis]XP_057689844.1 pleckstrin homology domain-containing family G member 5 [Corythoichthys intestinalis]